MLVDSSSVVLSLELSLSLGYIQFSPQQCVQIKFIKLSMSWTLYHPMKKNDQSQCSYQFSLMKNYNTSEDKYYFLTSWKERCNAPDSSLTSSGSVLLAYCCDLSSCWDLNTDTDPLLIIIFNWTNITIHCCCHPYSYNNGLIIGARMIWWFRN